jgi:hypothetical protein
VNPQSKPGIINTTELAHAHPPSSPFTDGPNGHRVDNNHQDREIGSIPAPSHIPVNGMNHPRFFPRGAEFPQDLGRASHSATPVESMRASQGRLPKI